MIYHDNDIYYIIYISHEIRPMSFLAISHWYPHVAEHVHGTWGPSRVTTSASGQCPGGRHAGHPWRCSGFVSWIQPGHVGFHGIFSWINGTIFLGVDPSPVDAG